MSRRDGSRSNWVSHAISVATYCGSFNSNPYIREVEEVEVVPFLQHTSGVVFGQDITRNVQTVSEALQIFILPWPAPLLKADGYLDYSRRSPVCRSILSRRLLGVASATARACPHDNNIVTQPLSRQSHPPTNTDELWTRVEAAWQTIPQEHIHGLFDSMLQRVQAVHGKDKARELIDTLGTVKSIGDDSTVLKWKGTIELVIRGTGQLHFKFDPSKSLHLKKRGNVHGKVNLLVKWEVNYCTYTVKYRSIFKKNNDVNHVIPEPLPIRVHVKAAKLKDDIIDGESDIAEESAEESDSVEHGDENDLDLRHPRRRNSNKSRKDSGWLRTQIKLLACKVVKIALCLGLTEHISTKIKLFVQFTCFDISHPEYKTIAYVVDPGRQAECMDTECSEVHGERWLPVACGDVLLGKLVLAQCCTHSAHAAGTSSQSGAGMYCGHSRESGETPITRVLIRLVVAPGLVYVANCRESPPANYDRGPSAPARSIFRATAGASREARSPSPTPRSPVGQRVQFALLISWTKDEVDRSRWLHTIILLVPILNCNTANTASKNGVDEDAMIGARDPLTSWRCPVTEVNPCPKLKQGVSQTHFGQRIRRRYSDCDNVTSLDAEFRMRPRPRERPIVNSHVQVIFTAPRGCRGNHMKHCKKQTADLLPTKGALGTWKRQSLRSRDVSLLKVVGNERSGLTASLEPLEHSPWLPTTAGNHACARHCHVAESLSYYITIIGYSRSPVRPQASHVENVSGTAGGVRVFSGSSHFLPRLHSAASPPLTSHIPRAGRGDRYVPRVDQPSPIATNPLRPYVTLLKTRVFLFSFDWYFARLSFPIITTAASFRVVVVEQGEGGEFERKGVAARRVQRTSPVGVAVEGGFVAVDWGWREDARLLYLELYSTLETERRGSDKDDTTTRIKSHIASKRKALNWRAVFSSCCICNFNCAAERSKYSFSPRYYRTCVQRAVLRKEHTPDDGRSANVTLGAAAVVTGAADQEYMEMVDLCGRHTLQAGVEPVNKEMALGTELSDFDKGVIEGCHLSELSSWAIARKEFHTATGVLVSIGTLRTEAHRLGYFGRAAAHKPHITTSNKARRLRRCLRWCLDRRNWTIKQWKWVLWSDESRFTLFRSDGRVWVWHLPGERLLLECIMPTRKFGGGVILWGCFTAFGVGPLVFVRGSMNTEAYCNILDNEMLPTLWRVYRMDPCYFQDDNARYHVSRATMQWYADNNVRRLDWPAQSPDLNPIEHIWDELDRRVRARQARPKSIAQLVEWLQEEWRRIPVDVLQTLVESMPDRVAAVLAARVQSLALSSDGALDERDTFALIAPALLDRRRGRNLQTPQWRHARSAGEGRARGNMYDLDTTFQDHTLPSASQMLAHGFILLILKDNSQGAGNKIPGLGGPMFDRTSVLWIIVVASCQDEPGSIPGAVTRVFTCRKRGGLCCWSAGFLTELPFLPLAFHCCSISPHFTYANGQLLSVQCQPERLSATIVVEVVERAIHQYQDAVAVTYSGTMFVAICEGRCRHWRGTTASHSRGTAAVLFAAVVPTLLTQLTRDTVVQLDCTRKCKELRLCNQHTTSVVRIICHRMHQGEVTAAMPCYAGMQQRLGKYRKGYTDLRFSTFKIAAPSAMKPNYGLRSLRHPLASQPASLVDEDCTIIQAGGRLFIHPKMLLKISRRGKKVQGFYGTCQTVVDQGRVLYGPGKVATPEDFIGLQAAGRAVANSPWRRDGCRRGVRGEGTVSLDLRMRSSLGVWGHVRRETRDLRALLAS
ncbi:hypothetical protein PR048_024085 [Dryococelus australis]|uniref:Tc1-like transposase DDE domain-containing protein n=1 Tax=Dryococelus australis TaxID=614101 RepID=A0ABQ9GVX1_9NEOP|nr:hypothetical protein PR048_024085 [Dryococelus australis]